jgi:metal-responsive CopG/Arc/MetJ family transcriptional regulator
VHISLDPKLVRDIDRRVGKRRRSAFIAAAARRAVEEAQLWENLEAGIGAISSTGHVWDPDPAAWVHAQRRLDHRRVG